MSSRQVRRQAARTGGPSPTQRDPMRPIYIGFAIAIVLIVLGFAAFRYKQVHEIQAAYATPTPGPLASEKPIMVDDTKTFGAKFFPPGPTKNGGLGRPVDGVQCEPTEQVRIHTHSVLSLYHNGKQYSVPQYVGMVPDFATQSIRCLYWIHTHDASGIIHVEAPEVQAYKLGTFFKIWGQPLSATQVGPWKGQVTMFVNGMKYTGDPNDIPLSAHNNITLEVGTPIIPPKNYQLVPGL